MNPDDLPNDYDDYDEYDYEIQIVGFYYMKEDIPEDYDGPLPFDRFGMTGHNFYKPNHSGKYGHYCPDWDYLYICEDCDEFKSCTCFKNLPMTQEDLLWAEELYPLLDKVTNLCASNHIPFDFKMGAEDPYGKFTITIKLDKNRNYKRNTSSGWETLED